MTVVDWQNLVEGSRDVESYSPHLPCRLTAGNLLASHPSLVGAAELQLVPVFANLPAAEDRHELRQLHLSDACELLIHLPLLHLELLIIWQGLPFTSATHSEVLAERLFPHGTFLNEAYHFGFHIAMSFLPHLQVYYVARHAERHKHYHVVHSRQRLTLSRTVGYLYVLKYW